MLIERRKMMKTIAVRVDDETHMKMKIRAAKQGKTVSDIMKELLEKELEKEKE